MKQGPLSNRILLKQIVLMALCLLPILGMAQQDTERQYLALLANEINALDALVHKAELNRDKDARVKFQYEQLRADLTETRAAILRHVNAPRTTPRKVAPLQGDYRQ